MGATDELIAELDGLMLIGQLARLGIRADECSIPDKRTLVDIKTGRHIGTMTGREAWDWIRAQEKKS